MSGVSQQPNVPTMNSAPRGIFGMYSQPALQESSASRSFDNIFANITPSDPARAQLLVEAQNRNASENCDKLDDENDNRMFSEFCT